MLTLVLIQIESLVWDIDFKTKVTREEYEAACSDLFDGFTRPIYDALLNAGLTMVRSGFSIVWLPP